jgi:hypothetical protein
MDDSPHSNRKAPEEKLPSEELQSQYILRSTSDPILTFLKHAPAHEMRQSAEQLINTGYRRPKTKGFSPADQTWFYHCHG